jgi:hypothetical protein
MSSAVTYSELSGNGRADTVRGRTGLGSNGDRWDWRVQGTVLLASTEFGRESRSEQEARGKKEGRPTAPRKGMVLSEDSERKRRDEERSTTIIIIQMAVEIRGSGGKANNVPESWFIVDYRAPDLREEKKDREERRKG